MVRNTKTSWTRRVGAAAAVALLAGCSSDDSEPAAVEPAATAISSTTTATSTTPAASDTSAPATSVAAPVTSTSTTATATTTTAAAPAGSASPSAASLRPEISADGEILFRETVAGFVINTVRAYGEDGLDHYVLEEAFEQTYPDVFFVNGVTEATTRATSFLVSTAVSDKDLPSAENFLIAAVAVLDTTGACLGVAAYGYPTLDQTFTADNIGTCTATAVNDAFLAQH